jgi:hypothetical protein
MRRKNLTSVRLDRLPIRPGLCMCPGWIPILQPRGLMIPGQLGPIRRDLDWLLRMLMTCLAASTTKKSRQCRATTNPHFVSLGYALRDADDQGNLVLYGLDDGSRGIRRGHVYDTRIRSRFSDSLFAQWVSRRRMSAGRPTSFTVLNTGRPRCVWPPLFGDVPPTIFVPNARASLM